MERVCAPAFSDGDYLRALTILFSVLMKYWEIIANRLSKVGWGLGWVSAIDCQGRTIWIVDVHRGDGRRFIVHADEKLSAFVELERVTCESLRFLNAE
jgi:hypothetical protein